MSEDLKNIFNNLKSDYDSGEGDDLGADFFTPCLNHCKKYDRATSDFTSNVIFEWGEAVLKLVDIDNYDCKIRMIADINLACFAILFQNDIHYNKGVSLPYVKGN